jgi:hypothetical protein
MKAEQYSLFEKMPSQDRVDIFSIVAAKRGISPAYVEKDFWVCRVLDVLMREPPFMPKCYFKGGTSLSKGFGLIERFSEDVDIIYSRAGLGYSGDDDPTDLKRQISNKERERQLEALVERAADYTRKGLCEKLQSKLPTCTITVEGLRPEAVTAHVTYPSVFPADGYVAHSVRVEGGARGALTPTIASKVTPYIQEAYPGRFDLQVDRVTMISPSRTFLEKIIAVHGFNNYRGVEAAQGKAIDANRFSRHFYDLSQLWRTAFSQKALADAELLAHVVEHSRMAFRGGKYRYDLAVPSTMKLTPDPSVQSALKTDYAAMRGMMYGNPPTFDDIMANVSLIENDLRRLASVSSGTTAPDNVVAVKPTYQTNNKSKPQATKRAN